MQKAHNSMKVKTVPSYLIAPSFRLKLSSSTGTYGAGRRLQGQTYVWQAQKRHCLPAAWVLPGDRYIFPGRHHAITALLPLQGSDV